MRASGAGTTLALVVNTRNEANRLPHLLQSVRGIDEIVVADMESQDATVEVARAAGATVITLPNAGYCEPGRMPAIRAATSDWVLVLDADEWLEDGALERIRRLIEATPDSVAAYRLARLPHLGGRAIHGSGWERANEMHPRLFRRLTVDWPVEIHAVPTFDGAVLDADGLTIQHANFDDLEHFYEKLNRYSTVEAKQIVDAGNRPSIPMALRFGLEEIVHRYDPERDGAVSMALALGMFAYRFDSHAKALETLGWPAAYQIDRTTLVRAVNGFWSELRSRELHRLRIAAESREDHDDLEILREAIAVWETMPSTLALHEVQVGEEPDGPWSQAEADREATLAVLTERLLTARRELNELRRQLTDAETRVADISAAHEQQRSRFAELLLLHERTVEALRDADRAAARAGPPAQPLQSRLQNLLRRLSNGREP